jgi:serine/threonine-protein kinase
MVSNRWEEMKALFEAALLQDESDWQAFLASRCGSDMELAAEVQKLLIADRDSGHFLTAPLIEPNSLLESTTLDALPQLRQILCGRFEVLAYLGEGGMGQVYEALDLELKQRIAIKAIRSEIAEIPGVLSRFKREVYTTRKITHPNVCRTFDLECHTGLEADRAGSASKITFLTMELLRGETLAQRLRRVGPLLKNQVHELAMQVSYALQAAHGAGVVHCDLKPSNIFLTGTEFGQRVVVTDFGIAKIIRSQDQSSVSQSSAPDTRSGLAGGTPAYMAPEQLERGECTPRTDIYSLGLIIYEALTGERLFPLSCSPRDFQSRVRRAADDSNHRGVAWSVLLSSCLQANPEDRFAHVQEVLDLLQKKPTPSLVGILSTMRAPKHVSRRAVAPWFRFSNLNRGLFGVGIALAVGLAAALITYHKPAAPAHGEVAIASVVVLPFASPNGDSDLNMLGNSIAVNLTNKLAKVTGLRVRSQTTLAGLGKNPDLNALSKRLQVESVVDGSVARTADGLLVQVELVDARTGTHRWGQSYFRKLEDISSLQQDISLEIAFLLRLDASIAPNHTSPHRQTSSPEAQEAFRKGETALAPHTAASAEKAASDFQLAIDADPEFAPAFEQLAECYLAMANKYNKPEAPLDLRNEAENAAMRALELDGTSAAAYTDIARVRVLRDFDWNAAEKYFNRAIQIDAGYIPAHTSYAFYVLTARRRFAEARAQYAYADRSVPRVVGVDVNEAIAEYFARHFDESAQRAEALRKIHPEIEVLVELLADDFLGMDQPARAVALINSSSAKSEDTKISRDAMLGVAFARLGQKGKARRILNQIEKSRKPNFNLNFHLAALAAALGDKSRAFAFLQDAYDARQVSVLFLDVDALVDPLRSDPRFQQMLIKLNLSNSKRNGEN